MLRRLFALVLLVAIGFAAFYFWRQRSGVDPTLASTRGSLGSDVRDLGAQARDQLGAVGQKIEDAKVVASVKTALSLNRDLHNYKVAVASQDGIVTLRGRVDSEPMRRKAEALASAVPDVARVVNELQTVAGVSQASGDDRTLGESLDEHTLQVQVRLALSLQRELKGTDVKVDVDRHQVTLSGEVATRGQGDLAVETARDTSSVANVVDHLRVQEPSASGSPLARHPASAGAEAAQRAVRANASLAGFDLQVREEGGRLVLRGQLGTHAEKDLAGLLAREAAGGPVENLAEVRSGTQ